jgi:hypothetical protein
MQITSKINIWTLVLVILIGCSSNDKTAGGSGTGTETTDDFVATVYTEAGLPVQGARVYAFPANLRVDTAWLQSPDQIVLDGVIEAVSNNKGAFSLPLSDGEWIVSVESDSLLNAQRVSCINSQCSGSGDDTLRSPAIIQGTTDISTCAPYCNGVWIRLVGLPYGVFSSTGEWSLQVPQGNFNIEISTGHPYIDTTLLNVDFKSGEISNLGSIAPELSTEIEADWVLDSTLNFVGSDSIVTSYVFNSNHHSFHIGLSYNADTLGYYANVFKDEQMNFRLSWGNGNYNSLNLFLIDHQSSDSDYFLETRLNQPIANWIDIWACLDIETGMAILSMNDSLYTLQSQPENIVFPSGNLILGGSWLDQAVADSSSFRGQIRNVKVLENAPCDSTWALHFKQNL